MINESKIPIERNEALLDLLDRWIADNEDAVLKDIQTIDPATGLIRSDLPGPLQDWLRRGQEFGYTVALSPPENAPLTALWRATKDDEGRILAARPWLPFMTEGAVAANPGKWQRTKAYMFRGIRHERILYANRRRFIRNMIINQGVPPALSRRIFRQIMVEAGERGVSARGLESRELMD